MTAYPDPLADLLRVRSCVGAKHGYMPEDDRVTLSLAEAQCQARDFGEQVRAVTRDLAQVLDGLCLALRCHYPPSSDPPGHSGKPGDDDLVFLRVSHKPSLESAFEGRQACGARHLRPHGRGPAEHGGQGVGHVEDPGGALSR